MTEKPTADDLLEGFFSAARAYLKTPTPAFMAQVMQQARTLQAEVSAQPRVVVRHQKRTLLSDVLWLIGGKQALVGLTSAMVVGVWIGLSPPDFVADQLQSYFETGETLGSDSLWAVDSFGGFTVTTTEG